MARCVQQPDSPGYAAIVLQGGRGTGKSFFVKEFGSLFGPHMLHISDSKHLVGSFNAHLRDCIVLFGDEAFYAGDKKHESILKMLITEETIAIEAKGIDMETCPNFTHIILASNDEWVIPAGSDERRFFVLNVGEDRKGCHEYFSKIKVQMDNGGREALLHYLMHHDIGTFEVRDVPKTKALQQQKAFSMSPVDEWIFLILQDGILPKVKDENISLSEDLLDHARASVPKLKNASFRALAEPLKKLGCEPYSSGAKRGWKFLPLTEARQLFDKKYGPQEWDDTTQTRWGHPTPTEDKPPF